MFNNKKDRSIFIKELRVSNIKKDDPCNINEVNELKHQDKVINKIIPLYFLIDNYVRTESK